MNFYFESIEKDLEIKSLACDININKALMSIDYYTNIYKFYNETKNDNNSIFIEAGNKISKGLKVGFDAVLNFIDTCVQKIKEMIASHKVKKAIKVYNDIIKKDPTLANKKIKYIDELDIAKAKDASIKKSSKKHSIFEIKKDIENLHEKITNIKPKIKTASIGACIALLGGLSISIYKNSNERKNTLKQIRDSISHANNYAERIKHDVITNKSLYNEEDYSKVTGMTQDVYKYCVQASKESSISELSTIKSVIKNILYELDLMQNGTKPHSTAHIDNI